MNNSAGSASHPSAARLFFSRCLFLEPPVSLLLVWGSLWLRTDPLAHVQLPLLDQCCHSLGRGTTSLVFDRLAGERTDYLFWNFAILQQGIWEETVIYQRHQRGLKVLLAMFPLTLTPHSVFLLVFPTRYKSKQNTHKLNTKMKIATQELACSQLQNFWVFCFFKFLQRTI